MGPIAAQAPGAIAAIQQAADALHAAARGHKHAEAYHRRAARETMQRLAELERACAALGIRMIVTRSQSDGDIDHGLDPRP